MWWVLWYLNWFYFNWFSNSPKYNIGVSASHACPSTDETDAGAGGKRGVWRAEQPTAPGTGAGPLPGAHAWPIQRLKLQAVPVACVGGGRGDFQRHRHEEQRGTSYSPTFFFQTLSYSSLEYPILAYVKGLYLCPRVIIYSQNANIFKVALTSFPSC